MNAYTRVCGTYFQICVWLSASNIVAQRLPLRGVTLASVGVNTIICARFHAENAWLYAHHSMSVSPTSVHVRCSILIIDT